MFPYFPPTVSQRLSDIKNYIKGINNTRVLRMEPSAGRKKLNQKFKIRMIVYIKICYLNIELFFLSMSELLCTYFARISLLLVPLLNELTILLNSRTVSICLFMYSYIHFFRIIKRYLE